MYRPELVDWDEKTFDAHWQAIDRFIQDAGRAEAYSTGLRLWTSVDVAAQSAGLDLLGVMARTDSVLFTQVLDFARLAATSPNPDLRWSAAVSMRFKSDDRAQQILLQLLGDPDPDVRFQAVSGLPLPHQLDLPDFHPVVQGLLGAMEDPDDDVREWATFGLGAQLTVDSPMLRDALARKLDDEHDGVVGEAATGLAKRGDSRVFDLLVKRLRNIGVNSLFVRAAEELADARLITLLVDLREKGWSDPQLGTLPLDYAIKACSAS